MKTLPQTGEPWPEIERRLKEAKQGDFDWRGGRVPYYIYFYDDALLEVQKRAYTAYLVENALSARGAFPSLGRMTDEIFEMAFGIFHAPARAGASFTSGGTESVFQAIKSAREKAVAERRVSRPNLVTAYSRHPSVNKAAHILGIEARITPVGKDFRADVDAMRAAMDDQTVLLYASSPSFPYGVIDPIRDLGTLALERGVWLHSDACFGGFVSPFAKKLGYAIPEFDLSVPGVTSLSADIHKFGFGCKGASVLLYADQRDEQRYGRYVVEDTASGPYATATFSGLQSRRSDLGGLGRDALSGRGGLPPACQDHHGNHHAADRGDQRYRRPVRLSALRRIEPVPV
ncbi:MAG: aspartate aminotransferase family protein [Gemmatimonadetes bacterium]|nr:aspartate aminotransferase family protein [Gemmatimonadota bacterium]